MCERASSSFGSPLPPSAVLSSFIEKPIKEAPDTAPLEMGSSTTVEARDVRGEVDRELTETAPPPSRPRLDVSLFEGRSRIAWTERTGAVSGADATSHRLDSAAGAVPGAVPGAAAMRFGCRRRLGADAWRFDRRKGAVSGGADVGVEARSSPAGFASEPAMSIKSRLGAMGESGGAPDTAPCRVRSAKGECAVLLDGEGAVSGASVLEARSPFEGRSAAESESREWPVAGDAGGGLPRSLAGATALIAPPIAGSTVDIERARSASLREDGARVGDACSAPSSHTCMQSSSSCARSVRRWPPSTSASMVTVRLSLGTLRSSTFTRLR